jgi:hypothetical protein
MGRNWGWAITEIGGIGDLRVGQARLQSIVTGGAELLLGRRHSTRALVLGVTIDTPAAGLLKALATARWKPANPVGSPARLQQTRAIGDMLVRILRVAGHAGIVAHGHEGLHVAGLAIAAEVLVREAEVARGPCQVAVNPCRSARILVQRERLVQSPTTRSAPPGTPATSARQSPRLTCACRAAASAAV